MGWIALVGPEIEENLSLRYLAASLQTHGFPTEILPFHLTPHFGEVLRRITQAPEPPVVVGLSLAFQWRAMDMLAVAVELRKLGYRGHITAGGHFGTFAAAELLADFPELDSICRHESEETLVELVQKVSRGESLAGMPGLAQRTDDGHIILGANREPPELTSLPRADRRGEPASCLGHNIAPLVGTRGCYANCSFCCIAAWHEQTLPGKRYRIRTPEDVAAEMVSMQRERGIEIFVFHDDNFFLPRHRDNVTRINALADALEAAGIGRFATVVKARPTDVRTDAFEPLKRRLNCIRCYVGIETDADQGLETLRRWSTSRKNHEAIQVIRDLDLFTCFNMLIFDPDTTLESLETNLDFMEFARESPSNFGRVELYAGTPLLDRMQQEGRARGDYLQWDYDMATPEVQRVMMLALRAFRARNFGKGAVANHIMGTRFDIEVARHFHPEAFKPRWIAEGKRLVSELTQDTVDALRRIIGHARTEPVLSDEAFLQALQPALRSTEQRIWEGCRALARDMETSLERGPTLTTLGDVVATPLQRAVAEI